MAIFAVSIWNSASWVSLFFVMALFGSQPALAQSQDPEQAIAAANAEVDQLHREGKNDEALKLALETAAMAEAQLPAVHRAKTESLENLRDSLVAVGRTDEALKPARTVDDHLAFWSEIVMDRDKDEFLRNTIGFTARLTESFHLTLALRHPSEKSARFGVDLVLKWKGRPLQEAIYLAGLIRNSQDPRAIEAAETLRNQRKALANAVSHGDVAVENASALKLSVTAAEAELQRQSQDYRLYSQVKHATAQDVQDVLPQGSALIEYRFFSPLEADQGALREAHLLAAVLRPDRAPVLFDLGEGTPILERLAQFEKAKRGEIRLVEGEPDDGTFLPSMSTLTRREAYDHLIAPLRDHLAGIKRLFISPDGPLGGALFDAFLNEKEELLFDLYEIRMVQTGRTLIVRDSMAAAKGLVALGAIEFGASASPQPPFVWTERQHLGVGQDFMPLHESGAEVDAIAGLYARHRPNEPKPVIYKGLEATEARLMALAAPPRALHLATHSFYHGVRSLPETPGKSGVSLAGANDGLDHNSEAGGEHGILDDVKALNLNLFGTELVVLSGRETGLDNYGFDGPGTLFSAFSVAGAKNVLAVLRNVDEEGIREFMMAFYERWLQQPASDPAAALRDTKTVFRSHSNPNWRDQEFWSAFILFEK